MPDTAFVVPGTGANIAGVGPDWLTPGNITADDAAVANVVCGSNPVTVSDFLSGTNYTFGIPAGSTIDGIEVEIIDYTGEVGGG